MPLYRCFRGLRAVLLYISSLLHLALDGYGNNCRWPFVSAMFCPGTFLFFAATYHTMPLPCRSCCNILTIYRAGRPHRMGHAMALRAAVRNRKLYEKRSPTAAWTASLSPGSR